MPLARTAILLLGAAALSILPALAPDLPGTTFQVDKAYAKNGNGNGNGNSNGNGNGGGNAGGGNGKSGGNGNGNSGNSNRGGNSASSKSGGNGFGLFNRGKSKSQTASGNGKGVGGFLDSVFGGNGKSTKRQNASRGGGNNGKSHRLPKAERATLASVAVTPTASPLGKPKNFNAKLGRLNSLKRNYRALINSNSPHLAGIQAYINDTLAYEDGLAGLKALQDSLDEAHGLFAEQLDGIEPYDAYSYDDATAEDLEARLEALNAVDASTLTEEEAEALEAERTALGEALEGDEFTDFKDSEIAYREAEDGLSPLADKVSDEALEDALRDMANENRLREYGDDYVDADMLGWAKEILGVGDYDGKIDEIRDAGDVASSDDGGSDPTDDDLRLMDASN